MKNLSLLFFFFLITFRINAQQQGEAILSGKVAKQGIKYARSITVEDLKKHLYVLASDSLEGRDTGSKGMQKAAAYISNHFQSNNLQPVVKLQKEKSYLQPFELEKRTQEEGYLIINGNKYEHLQDVVFWGTDAIDKVQKEVVFVGYGRESDYQGKDVKSKAVLVLSDRTHDYFKVAKEKGADIVLIYTVVDTFSSMKDFIALNKEDLTKPTILSPSDKPLTGVKLSKEIVAQLLGINKDEIEKLRSKDFTATLNASKSLLPFSVTISSTQKVEKIGTENVLGYIEGTDKKQELIVITAHYDHDGISTPVKGDSIYNGADDDASGTVAVMELAQAFALAKQKGDGSRRSLLFLAVSAEEKGLLGSSYYVEHPLFPLQNTVTNINIDMIGRRDSTHVGKADYLYVVGADRLSGELHRVNEAVNTHYLKLNFDYKYNAKDDPENVYERSDHYNFAKKNIPVVFFTSGLHPDYHTPFDTADKIEYEALQKRTQMIFYLAWELSNRENKVKLNSMTEKQP